MKPSNLRSILNTIVHYTLVNLVKNIYTAVDFLLTQFIYCTDELFTIIERLNYSELFIDILNNTLWERNTLNMLEH